MIVPCHEDIACRATPIPVTEPSDLLGELFRNACLRCQVVETLHFTTPWGFRVGAGTAAFYYVLQGSCQLEVAGVDDALNLAVGDLVVLMPGHEHGLRDSRSSPSVPLRELLGIDATRMRRDVLPGEESRTTRLIYSSVVFDKRQIVPLLVSLPAVMVAPGAKGKAMPGLDQMLSFMIRESVECQPGSQSIVDHLAQVVFIQAVRACVGLPSRGGGQWLAALTDPEIGPALKVMHASLDSPWTVAALAEQVCLSRSVFASRFKTLLATSPMQYLMERRMQKACELLTEHRYGIKQIASRVGYASKAAFSNAFKRWNGQSPQAYRRRLPKTPTNHTDRIPGV